MSVNKELNNEKSIVLKEFASNLSIEQNIAEKPPKNKIKSEVIEVEDNIDLTKKFKVEVPEPEANDQKNIAAEEDISRKSGEFFREMEKENLKIDNDFQDEEDWMDEWSKKPKQIKIRKNIK